MSAARDLGPILRTWLRSDERELPAEVRAAVLATVAATPQRRKPWLPAFPRLFPGTTARRLAVVGLVLVTLAAMLGLALAIPLGGPRPTELERPRVGEVLPEGATEGTIATPLGPARWIHLSGDASTLPSEAARIQPVTWPSIAGDAPFTALRQGEGDGKLAWERWTSDDGLLWTSEVVEYPIETDSGVPYDGGGASWMTTFDPPGIWRSTDGERWQPIDMSAMIPEGPAALRWEVQPNSEMASTDSVTVAEVTVQAIDPFETLDWPLFSDPGDIVKPEPGLVLFPGSEEWERPDRFLRFEATAEGMRVIEVADGSVITDLPGVTEEDVDAWVRDGPPLHHRIGVVDGDRLVPTHELAAIGEPANSQSELGTMLGTPDAILALMLPADDGPAHLWRSEDGREWTDTGPWSIDPVGAGGEFQMGASTGQFHVEYHRPLGGLQAVWHSADGVTWEQVARDVPTENRPLELASGFIVHRYTEGGEAWSASADGSTWEPLDLAGLGIVIGNADWSHGAVGDTAFITRETGSGQRDLWILSFDTEPGAPAS